MALQSSGQINLSDIVDEFGDPTPSITKLSEFYGAGSNIPTSGTIKFSDFYGKRSWVDGYPKTATPSNSNLLWVPGNELGFRSMGYSQDMNLLAPPNTKIATLNNQNVQLTSGGDLGKIYFLDLDDLMEGNFTSVYDIVPSDVGGTNQNFIMNDITDTHFIIRARNFSDGNYVWHLYSYTYNPATQVFSATQIRTYNISSAQGISERAKILRNDIIIFINYTYSNDRGRLWQYDFSGNLIQAYDTPDNDTGNYWGRYMSYNKKYITVSNRLEFANEKFRTLIFEYDSNGLVDTVVNRVVGSNSYEPDGRIRKYERFLFFGDQLLIKDGVNSITSVSAYRFYDSDGITYEGNNGLWEMDYEEFDTNGNLNFYNRVDSWNDYYYFNNFTIGEKLTGHAWLGHNHNSFPIIMSDEWVKNNRLIGTWGQTQAVSGTALKYYTQLYDFHNDSIHFYDQFDLQEYRSDITMSDFQRYPTAKNIIVREEGILINYPLADSVNQNAYTGFGIAIPRN
jgi:hypothetical protein